MSEPLASEPLTPEPLAPEPLAAPLFGTLLVEVLLARPAPPLPAVPGWRLRLWPFARLGDATVEASPTEPGAAWPELAAALDGAGLRPLGAPTKRRAA